MEIRPGVGSLTLQVAPASLPALTRAWTAGQTLEALVVRTDPARGTVLLQLPEGEVEARTEIPLQPGNRLQLIPEPSVDGTRLLLRVQGDPLADMRLAALRQALPRATPLAPLFEALAQVLKSSLPLPEPVRREVQALLDARPTPERLTRPDGLRDALRNSGMELESRLADPGAPPPAGDLKARIFALLATLDANTPPPAPPPPDAATRAPAATPPANPTPDNPRSDAPATGAPQRPVPHGDLPANPTADLLGALARHAEGAAARLLFHQLQALPDAQPSPQWLFELPLRTPSGNETLWLRFERETEHEGNGAAAAPGWRVTIDLSTEEHGPLRAVVTWRAGEINARFFAERAATADKFRGQLQSLGARLAAAGIKVGAMEAHTGLPPTPTRVTTSLLSERA